MPRAIRNLTIAIVLVLSAFQVSAQQPPGDDLRNEIAALRQTVNAIQRDVAEIKAFLQALQRPSPPQNVVLDVAGRPMRGNPDAKLTLVEFADYECSFCGRYARDTFPQIDKEYIQTGKLRYYFIDLPLESIHKSAFKASEAARCAGEQGKFWEMHERLFANQKTLDQWAAHAAAVGLDATPFQACLDSGRHAAAIRANIATAQKAGVDGTPAFFLAYTEPGSTKIDAVARVSGAQPYSEFKNVLEKMAATAKE